MNGKVIKFWNKEDQNQEKYMNSVLYHVEQISHRYGLQAYYWLRNTI